jgi:hypothetical protein
MTTTYTTTKGNKFPLTPKLWKGIKRVSKNRFDGSERLFNACWKQYREYLAGSIEDPQSIEDVTGWLETIASEKVNNPDSTFYIYGK